LEREEWASIIKEAKAKLKGPYCCRKKNQEWARLLLGTHLLVKYNKSFFFRGFKCHQRVTLQCRSSEFIIFCIRQISSWDSYNSQSLPKIQREFPSWPKISAVFHLSTRRQKVLFLNFGDRTICTGFDVVEIKASSTRVFDVTWRLRLKTMSVISYFKTLQWINVQIPKGNGLSPSSLVSIGHWSNGVEENLSMCGKIWGNIIIMKKEELCYSETWENVITTHIWNPNEDCYLNNNCREKMAAQK
jgi:hypothetical protein